MANDRQRYARIIGTGGYLPEGVVHNNDFTKWLATSDEWIRTRTGICERRFAPEGVLTADCAEQAARHAIAAADIAIDTLDLIVVATTTPDKLFPSVACAVQHRLGVHGIPAFDVQAVCSGFSYALSVGEQFIVSGRYQRVLVIGADMMSRILDKEDRMTAVLFGDGAGAVVLTADTAPGILATHIHADGSYDTLLHTPGGLGYSHRADNDPYLRMHGREVFRISVRMMGDLAEKTLAESDYTADDLDWLIPHQANIRIIEALAKRLQLPMARVVVTVDKHGNTSSASIPLAFDCAIRDGRIQPGQLVMMLSFGGGFTWGSALVRI